MLTAVGVGSLALAGSEGETGPGSFRKIRSLLLIPQFSSHMGLLAFNSAFVLMWLQSFMLIRPKFLVVLATMVSANEEAKILFPKKKKTYSLKYE